MEILDSPAFLTLRSNKKKSSTIVELFPSYEEFLHNWDSSSRVSPAFRVKGLASSSPSSYKFSGEKQLFFIGPIHPEKIIGRISKKTCLWLSLGLLNIIVCSKSKEESESLKSWLCSCNKEEDKVNYEIWTLKNGTVNEVEFSKNESLDTNWQKLLINPEYSKALPEINEAALEFYPLFASTVTRSTILQKKFTDDTLSMAVSHAKVLKNYVENTNEDSPYRALDFLLNVNAGFSRLASQTFAGTSPILSKECHLWSHSLLGVGVATLALWNIRCFVEKTLGLARIPERFKLMANDPDNNIDLSSLTPPPKDFLASVKPPAGEDWFPLITYFSARDGWRGTSTTISAPVAAINSCSSTRWSLLTLTHEFSHIIISAIISDLYPDFSDSSEIEKFSNLWREGKPGGTLFEEIQRQLLFSIINMAMASNGDSSTENPDRFFEPDKLKILLRRWRFYIEETMVHVFDFLYFYGRDVERYIWGIWATWGTIPNVSSRIEDYVVRSISAVLSRHWRRDIAAEDYAKTEVKNALEKLQESDLGGRYVKEALRLIEENWDDRLKPKVRARRQLVKLVSTYLFSKEIASEIRGESEISGGTKDKEGYSLHRGFIEQKMIRNPLRFIEIYTRLAEPSSGYSLWMFYTLAFCLQSDE